MHDFPISFIPPVFLFTIEFLFCLFFASILISSIQFCGSLGFPKFNQESSSVLYFRRYIIAASVQKVIRHMFITSFLLHNNQPFTEEKLSHPLVSKKVWALWMKCVGKSDGTVTKSIKFFPVAWWDSPSSYPKQYLEQSFQAWTRPGCFYMWQTELWLWLPSWQILPYPCRHPYLWPSLRLILEFEFWFK